jgi:hypothetical protein
MKPFLTFLLIVVAHAQTQSDWITQVKNKPALDVREFEWAMPTGVSGVLSSSGSGKVLTFSRGPKGMRAEGYVYIYGGTGTAEAALVTATTCAILGGSACTITVTTANSHTGAWGVRSASAGWQEAANVAGSGGFVRFPAGTYLMYGPLVVPFDRQTYFSDSPTAVTITQSNAINLHRFVIVGSKSDVTIRGLGFEGNFANQTYTAATLNTAIDGTSSTRLIVAGNRFRAFGYSSSADASYSQVVSLYSAIDCQVRGNQFLSNFAFEVNVNAASGCAITDNTFGSPSLADSQTHVNWWDTYSAGFGTFVAQSSKILFSGNRMFGPQRSATLSAFGDLINVNGSNSSIQGYDIHILSNTFEGLGNGRGTVAVTNGSGTITGTNTTFASIDVGRTFQVEGDATAYTVSAYTSATQITVTPVISRATASGLRYLYVNSGDVIQVYNVDRFSVIGNSINNSGDMGIDVAASPAGYYTQHGVVANNVVRRSQVDAFYIGGAVFDVMYSGNIGLNAGLKQSSGHQACFELSPTDLGSQVGQNMWHLTFSGNQCIDDQAAATMLFGFQMEAGQSLKIFSNTLTGNTYFSYDGTGALFDSGTTATMQGTMFNTPSFMSTLQFTPVAFANLGSFLPAAANGAIAYCFDCTVASPCAGGGTGAIAKRLNGAWSCN